MSTKQYWVPIHKDAKDYLQDLRLQAIIHYRINRFHNFWCFSNWREPQIALWNGSRKVP
jgi:hypothetical protein